MGHKLSWHASFVEREGRLPITHRQAVSMPLLLSIFLCPRAALSFSIVPFLPGASISASSLVTAQTTTGDLPKSFFRSFHALLSILEFRLRDEMRKRGL